MFSFKQTLVVATAIVMSAPAMAQQKQLTDDQFFKNNFKGIVQPMPVVTRWVDNTHFLLVKDGKTYVVDAKTGVEREANDDDKKQQKIEVAPSAYSKNNDLYVKLNNVETRLTNDTLPEINATISPDNKFFAYTKKNDLYTVEIATQKETRLTTDGSDVIMNGYASWVYTEEILGRASRYRSFWWSPDSKHIAFFRTDDSPVPVFTITDAPGQHGYLETVRYPKVGDKNPEVKVGMVAPTGGAVVFADFNAKDDQYFGAPIWTNDGSSLWVQWMNRKQNNLKIYAVNPATGAKAELYDETQKTWIQLEDGFERMHMLKNNKNFILESDKTGWNNLYLYEMSGKLINPIAPGNYTVVEVNYIDEAKKVVYFTARSRENTARRDFYKVNFNGKNLQRLTFGDYNHMSINLSPDASYFVTTYNNVSTPTRSTLVNNAGKIIKEIGDSKGPELNDYNLAKTELIRVKSDDGLYDLPMRVTWPINYDKNKKYPVLISIYGGPNAGTVMDSWSLNGTQQFYAKEGLIQVAMDHRASGHFGKEGVNYMYHNLGYWEMKDYAAMAKWLIANGGADPKKICITGFSYGGYMSCYALTYGADVFTHGMAGGSVTDWTLYDTHYTERYMGTPADNPEGYKTSSVLNYVDKYKGMLQIVHGNIDDNVHLQNSIQLISKLQDLKKDFEMMFYSGGRHGWGGNKGVHFNNLKTQFIYKYLLEKPVPKAMLK
ncbi:DPP IV N-terminal domain-containing protein [Ferruginibacter yonginensis]|uniref:DPP IV N-terminal domain-containing protein n=1 Tax=Ferruginibacter yonginensis TaxID=1310416 RepID=A0ABV8QTG7_9BACT